MNFRSCLVGLNTAWGILFTLIIVIIMATRNSDRELNRLSSKEDYIRETRDSSALNYYLGYYYFGGTDTGIYNRYSSNYSGGLKVFCNDAYFFILSGLWMGILRFCQLHITRRTTVIGLLLCTGLSIFGICYSCLYFCSKDIQRIVIG